MSHACSVVSRRLLRRFRDTGVTDLEVRALSHPWRALRSTADIEARLARRSGQADEPHPPDAKYLDRSRAHWLLTDGADASVNAWLATAPIARVFEVGEPREMWAFPASPFAPSRRAPASQPSRCRSTNGGAASESRRVEIATAAGPVGSAEVSIEPDTTATISFEAAIDGRAFTARLSPADALHADDAASVATTSLLPVAVAIDPSCPSAVARAVRAHPALRESGTSDAGLAIQCSATMGVHEATPRVNLHDGAINALDGATLSWSSAVEGTVPELPMEFARRTRGRVEPPGVRDVVLLESGSTPLIPAAHGSAARRRDRRWTSPRRSPVQKQLCRSASDSLPTLPSIGGSSDRTVRAGRGSAASRAAPIAQLQAGGTERTLLRVR